MMQKELLDEVEKANDLLLDFLKCDVGVNFDFISNGDCCCVKFMGVYLWDDQNGYHDALKSRFLKNNNIDYDMFEDEDKLEDYIETIFPYYPSHDSLFILAKELLSITRKSFKEINICSSK